MTASLLIELGVEELPPKALPALMSSFANGIADELKAAELAIGEVSPYASPRRLAVLIKDTAPATVDKHINKPGPTVAIAFNEDGSPTKAAQGFAQSFGVHVEDLEQQDSKKGKRLVYNGTQPGQALTDILPNILDKVLKQLPIPKRMHWGSSDSAFIRPVHWLVALHGQDILPLSCFGHTAGRTTYGHRVHAPKPITLDQADDYVNKLQQAHVMVSPSKVQNYIQQQVQAAAKTLGATALINQELLQEVAALVEWPVVLAGRFSRKYLALPREVIISTLEGHQRYFPVEKDGQLCAQFITVANIDSLAPDQVIAGNERVIEPRLADAYFFWQHDLAQNLTKLAQGLGGVHYQKQLGSMADKTQRIAAISVELAKQLDLDPQLAEQAAQLAKADLLSEMVNEYPELQGIIGSYYAQTKGLAKPVSQAIGEQYAPQKAGAAIAASKYGQVLSLSDHLDTLAGIFAINQRPSGTKDPFGLRRAAIGVIRTLIEGRLDLDLRKLLAFCLEQQPVDYPKDTLEQLMQYHVDRLRGYYEEQHIAAEQFAAVAANHVTVLTDFDRRIHALSEFIKQRASGIVCQAHKRARNILRKNAQSDIFDLEISALSDDYAAALAHALQNQEKTFEQALKAQNYTQALNSLAQLAQPLDNFFENVMVMSDDPSERQNRLALLSILDRRCTQLADLSKLNVLVG